MITIHQRHRRTDGQTDTQATYHGNTTLRYASRGKNCLLDVAQTANLATCSFCELLINETARIWCGHDAN